MEGFSEVLAREVGPLGVRVTIVEPGGIRTDWAGSSMRIDEIRDDYKATVGAITRKSPDSVRGDPAKVAQAILKLAGLTSRRCASCSAATPCSSPARRRRPRRRGRALEVAQRHDGLRRPGRLRRDAHRQDDDGQED